MENMLVKFFEKKEYAESFVKGKLYLNTVSYFRKHEDSARGDDYEGRPTAPPIKSVTFNDTKFSVPEDAPLAHFSFEGIEFVNLLCFSNLKLSEEKDLKIDDKYYEEFGKHFVIIRNPDFFLYTFYRACIKSDYYFINDEVEYYDSSKGIDQMWLATREHYQPLRILMVKGNEFKWQREYRFVVDSRSDTNSPLKLDIGNIQDCVILRNVDEMLSENKSGG